MKALTAWVVGCLLCLGATPIALACEACQFTGVEVRGNGVSGSLTVPAGSTVLITASKKFGSDCSALLCNWTLNGVPMPWPEWGTVYYKFNTPGTYTVRAHCECTPCDRFGNGLLTVYVTSDPPPPVGPSVTITYTTFIPLDHVRLTGAWQNYFYEADNAGSFGPGVYRVQQTVTVRTGQGIVSSSRKSAVSRLFLKNSPTTNLTTLGPCYRKFCSECKPYPVTGTPMTFNGQCLIRETLELDSGPALNMTTVQATLVDAGYHDANRNYVTVRLSGRPKIGISPDLLIGALAPEIDWSVTIKLVRDKSTGQTTYTVAGNHDGFPFHDIRIGSNQVYGRDPIPHGDTPASLGGFSPGEIVVSKSGALP